MNTLHAAWNVPHSARYPYLRSILVLNWVLPPDPQMGCAVPVPSDHLQARKPLSSRDQGAYGLCPLTSRTLPHIVDIQ